MVRSLTSAASSEIAKLRGLEPIQIVSVDFGANGGKRYYSTRRVAMDTIALEPKLIEIDNLNYETTVDNLGAIGSASFSLNDAEGEIKVILDETHWHNLEVEIFHHFVGLAFVDMIRVFQGRVDSSYSWSEQERIISFQASTASEADLAKLEVETPDDLPLGFSNVVWIEGEPGNWVSTRGSEIVVNPSSYADGIYDHDGSIDRRSKDRVRGYTNIRLRDSSPSAGELVYRSFSSAKTLKAEHNYFGIWLRFWAKDGAIFKSTPSNPLISIVFDATSNFTGSDAQRVEFDLYFGLKEGKWRFYTRRFRLEADFSYQSFGFKLKRDLPAVYFKGDTISDPGWTAPAPKSDKFVKMRVDGLKLATLVETNVARFYADQDLPWPICFGEVTHVPAVQIDKLVVAYTAEDFFLHHKTNKSDRYLELTDGSKLPQNTTVRLSIEHSGDFGRFRKTIIEGIVRGNTVELVNSNPKHIQRQIKIRTRKENDPDSSNGEIAWLHKSTLVDMRGRVVFFDYNNEIIGGPDAPNAAEHWPCFVLGQSGDKLNILRVGDIDPNTGGLLLQRLSSASITSWVPDPELIGTCPWVEGYDRNGNLLADPKEFSCYGNAAHIEFMNSLAYLEAVGSSQFYAQLMTDTEILDIRNFPKWGDDYGRPEGGFYYIPAGAEVVVEDADLSTKYCANLYPSQAVTLVAAVKGETVTVGSDGFVVDTTDGGTADAGGITPDQTTTGRISNLEQAVSLVAKRFGAGAVSLPKDVLQRTAFNIIKSRKKKNVTSVFPTVAVAQGGDVLRAVPVDYYEVDLNKPFGDNNITLIKFPLPIDARDGENWDSQIYVSLRSTLTNNPVDAIQFLIEAYMPRFQIDADSFNCVRTLVTVPANFALFTSFDVNKTIEEIAYQAKCALVFDGNTIKIRYLDQEPELI